MERIWRKVMNTAKQNPKTIQLCADQKLLDNLKECNKLLDQVPKFKQLNPSGETVTYLTRLVLYHFLSCLVLCHSLSLSLGSKGIE